MNLRKNKIRGRSLLLRSTALFVAICVFVTSHTSVPAFASRNVPAQEMAIDVFDQAIQTIMVPDHLGHVVDVFQGNSKKRMILIEDAHSIPSAQRNIQKLIDYLKAEYGIRFVGVEGAAKELDTQIFKSFPEQEKLRSLMDEYFDRGELTGVNASALLSKDATIYQGIEDIQLYQDGMRHYLRTRLRLGELLKMLDKKKQEVNQQKKQIYSKELYEIDKALEAFYQNQINVADILKLLSKVRAPHPESKLFPILKIYNSDRSIEKEITKMVKEIEAAYSGRVPPDYNQKKQAYQTGELGGISFASYLKSFTKGDKEYFFSEHLEKLVHYEIELRKLKGSQLVKELDEYVTQVKRSLFRSEDEKRLDRQSEALRDEERLARFELDRGSWDVMKSAMSASSRGSNLGEAAFNGRSSTDDILFEPHIAFYRNAEAREQAFLENIFQKTDQSAVLVAGGFHTAGLAKLLKEKGITYLLIRPEIDVLPQENLYELHMKGDVSWKDYYEPKNGMVNIYEAFVRHVRDQLLKGLPIRKHWRDQIIRDLADKNQTEKHTHYTRFLDELSKKGTDTELSLRHHLMLKMNGFISNLRKLDATHQLTEPNILKLFKPSNIVALNLSMVLNDLAIPLDLTQPDLKTNLIVGHEETRVELRTMGPKIERDPKINVQKRWPRTTIIHHEDFMLELRKGVLSDRGDLEPEGYFIRTTSDGHVRDHYFVTDEEYPTVFRHDGHAQWVYVVSPESENNFTERMETDDDFFLTKVADLFGQFLTGEIDKYVEYHEVTSLYHFLKEHSEYNSAPNWQRARRDADLETHAYQYGIALDFTDDDVYVQINEHGYYSLRYEDMTDGMVLLGPSKKQGRVGFEWTEPLHSETVKSGIDSELMNSGLQIIKTRRILELLLKHMNIPVSGRFGDERALSKALLSIPNWVEAKKEAAEKKKEQEYETIIHGYLSRIETIKKGYYFGFSNSQNILGAHEDLIAFFESQQILISLDETPTFLLQAYLFSRADSKKVFEIMQLFQSLAVDESFQRSLFESPRLLAIYLIASMLDLDTTSRWLANQRQSFLNVIGTDFVQYSGRTDRPITIPSIIHNHYLNAKDFFDDSWQIAFGGIKFLEEKERYRRAIEAVDSLGNYLQVWRRGGVAIADPDRLDAYQDQLLDFRSRINQKLKVETAQKNKLGGRKELRTSHYGQLIERNTVEWLNRTGVPSAWGRTFGDLEEKNDQRDREDLFVKGWRWAPEDLMAVNGASMQKLVYQFALLTHIFETHNKDPYLHFDPRDTPAVFLIEMNEDSIALLGQAAEEGNFMERLKQLMPAKHKKKNSSVIYEYATPFGYKLWTHFDRELKRYPKNAGSVNSEQDNRKALLEFVEVLSTPDQFELSDLKLERLVSQTGPYGRLLIVTHDGRPIYLPIRSEYLLDEGNQPRRFWIKINTDPRSNKKAVTLYLSPEGPPIGFSILSEDGKKFEAFHGPVFRIPHSHDGGAPISARFEAWFRDPWTREEIKTKLPVMLDRRNAKQISLVSHKRAYWPEGIHFHNKKFELGEQVPIHATSRPGQKRVRLTLDEKMVEGVKRSAHVIERFFDPLDGSTKAPRRAFSSEVPYQFEKAWDLFVPSSMMGHRLGSDMLYLRFNPSRHGIGIRPPDSRIHETKVNIYVRFLRKTINGKKRKVVSVYTSNVKHDTQYRPIDFVWEGYFDEKKNELVRSPDFKPGQLIGSERYTVQLHFWGEGFSVRPTDELLTAKDTLPLLVKTLTNQPHSVAELEALIEKQGYATRHVLGLLNELLQPGNEHGFRAVHVGSDRYSILEPFATSADGRFYKNGRQNTLTIPGMGQVHASGHGAFQNDMLLEFYPNEWTNQKIKTDPLSLRRIWTYDQDGSTSLFSTSTQMNKYPNHGNFIFSNYGTAQSVERADGSTTISVVINGEAYRIPALRGERVSGVVREGKVIMVNWYAPGRKVHQPYVLERSPDGKYLEIGLTAGAKSIRNISNQGKPITFEMLIDALKFPEKYRESSKYFLRLPVPRLERKELRNDGDVRLPKLGGTMMYQDEHMSRAVEVRKIEHKTYLLEHINSFHVAYLAFRFLRENGKPPKLEVRKDALNNKWMTLHDVGLKEGMPIVIKKGFRKNFIDSEQEVDLEPHFEGSRIGIEPRIVIFGNGYKTVYLPKEVYSSGISRGIERSEWEPRPGYYVNGKGFVEDYQQAGHVEIKLIGSKITFSDLGSTNGTIIGLKKGAVEVQVAASSQTFKEQVEDNTLSPDQIYRVKALTQDGVDEFQPDSMLSFPYQQPFQVSVLVEESKMAVKEFRVEDHKLFVFDEWEGKWIPIPTRNYMAEDPIPLPGQTLTGFNPVGLTDGYQVYYDPNSGDVTVYNYTSSKTRVEALSPSILADSDEDFSKYPTTPEGFIDHGTYMVPKVMPQGEALKEEIRNYINQYIVDQDKRELALEQLNVELLLPFMNEARKYNVLLIVDREINFGLGYFKQLNQVLQKIPTPMLWEFEKPIGIQVTRLIGKAWGYLSKSDTHVGGGLDVTQLAVDLSREVFNQDQMEETVIHEILGHKRSLGKRAVYEIKDNLIRKVRDTWQVIMSRGAWQKLGEVNLVRALIPWTDELRHAVKHQWSIMNPKQVALDRLPEDPQGLLNLLRNYMELSFQYFEDLLEVLAFTTNGEDLSLPDDKGEIKNEKHRYAETRDILEASNSRIGIPLDPKHDVYVSYPYDPETRRFDPVYYKRTIEGKEEIWQQASYENGRWELQEKIIRIPKTKTVGRGENKNAKVIFGTLSKLSQSIKEVGGRKELRIAREATKKEIHTEGSAMWTRKLKETGLDHIFTDELVLGIVNRAWAQIFSRIPSGSKVIDLASGNMFLSNRLMDQVPDVSVYAVDFSDIEKKKIREGIQFIKSDLETMATDGRIPRDADFVVSQFGIEYTNLDRTLAQINQVLEVGKVGFFLMHHKNSVIANKIRRELEEIHFSERVQISDLVKAIHNQARTDDLKSLGSLIEQLTKKVSQDPDSKNTHHFLSEARSFHAFSKLELSASQNPYFNSLMNIALQDKRFETFAQHFSKAAFLNENNKDEFMKKIQFYGFKGKITLFGPPQAPIGWLLVVSKEKNYVEVERKERQVEKERVELRYFENPVFSTKVNRRGFLRTVFFAVLGLLLSPSKALSSPNVNYAQPSPEEVTWILEKGAQGYHNELARMLNEGQPVDTQKLMKKYLFPLGQTLLQKYGHRILELQPDVKAVKAGELPYIYDLFKHLGEWYGKHNMILEVAPVNAVLKGQFLEGIVNFSLGDFVNMPRDSYPELPNFDIDFDFFGIEKWRIKPIMTRLRKGDIGAWSRTVNDTPRIVVNMPALKKEAARMWRQAQPHLSKTENDLEKMVFNMRDSEGWYSLLEVLLARKSFGDKLKMTEEAFVEHAQYLLARESGIHELWHIYEHVKKLIPDTLTQEEQKILSETEAGLNNIVYSFLPFVALDAALDWGWGGGKTHEYGQASQNIVQVLLSALHEQKETFGMINFLEPKNITGAERARFYVSQLPLLTPEAMKKLAEDGQGMIQKKVTSLSISPSPKINAVDKNSFFSVTSLRIFSVTSITSVVIGAILAFLLHRKRQYQRRLNIFSKLFSDAMANPNQYIPDDVSQRDSKIKLIQSGARKLDQSDILWFSKRALSGAKPNQQEFREKVNARNKENHLTEKEARALVSLLTWLPAKMELVDSSKSELRGKREVDRFHSHLMMVNLPLSFSGLIFLINDFMWLSKLPKVGGITRTQTIPGVSTGEYRLESQKSLSRVMSTLASLRARLYTSPFLSPLGHFMTSHPARLSMGSSFPWKFSSARNRNRDLGGTRGERLTTIDHFAGPVERSLNRTLRKGRVAFENVINRVATFYHSEDERYRNSSTLKAGLSMTDVSSDADVPSNRFFHSDLNTTTAPRTSQDPHSIEGMELVRGAIPDQLVSKSELREDDEALKKVNASSRVQWQVVSTPERVEQLAVQFSNGTEKRADTFEISMEDRIRYKNFRAYFEQFEQQEIPLSFAPDLKGSHILIIGPSSNPHQLLGFAREFPQIKSIHFVDLEKAMIRELAESLEKELNQRPSPIQFRGYVGTVLDEALVDRVAHGIEKIDADALRSKQGAIDLVFDSYVFADGFWDQGQFEQAGNVIESLLKDNGIRISGVYHRFPASGYAKSKQMIEIPEPEIKHPWSAFSFFYKMRQDEIEMIQQENVEKGTGTFGGQVSSELRGEGGPSSHPELRSESRAKKKKKKASDAFTLKTDDGQTVSSKVRFRDLLNLSTFLISIAAFNLGSVYLFMRFFVHTSGSFAGPIIFGAIVFYVLSSLAMFSGYFMRSSVSLGEAQKRSRRVLKELKLYVTKRDSVLKNAFKLAPDVKAVERFQAVLQDGREVTVNRAGERLTRPLITPWMATSKNVMRYLIIRRSLASYFYDQTLEEIESKIGHTSLLIGTARMFWEIWSDVETLKRWQHYPNPILLSYILFHLVSTTSVAPILMLALAIDHIVRHPKRAVKDLWRVYRDLARAFLLNQDVSQDPVFQGKEAAEKSLWPRPYGLILPANIIAVLAGVVIETTEQKMYDSFFAYEPVLSMTFGHQAGVGVSHIGDSLSRIDTQIVDGTSRPIVTFNGFLSLPDTPDRIAVEASDPNLFPQILNSFKYGQLDVQSSQNIRNISIGNTSFDVTGRDGEVGADVTYQFGSPEIKGDKPISFRFVKQDPRQPAQITVFIGIGIPTPQSTPFWFGPIPLIVFFTYFGWTFRSLMELHRKKGTVPFGGQASSELREEQRLRRLDELGTAKPELRGVESPANQRFHFNRYENPETIRFILNSLISFDNTVSINYDFHREGDGDVPRHRFYNDEWLGYLPAQIHQQGRDFFKELFDLEEAPKEGRLIFQGAGETLRPVAVGFAQESDTYFFEISKLFQNGPGGSSTGLTLPFNERHGSKHMMKLKKIDTGYWNLGPRNKVEAEFENWMTRPQNHFDIFHIQNVNLSNVLINKIFSSSYHASVDFQTELWKIRDSVADQNVIDVGVGSGIQALWVAKYGAKAYYGTEPFAVPWNIARWNIQYAKETGQIPREFTTKILNQAGVYPDKKQGLYLANLPAAASPEEIERMTIQGKYNTNTRMPKEEFEMIMSDLKGRLTQGASQALVRVIPFSKKSGFKVLNADAREGEWIRPTVEHYLREEGFIGALSKNSDSIARITGAHSELRMHEYKSDYELQMDLIHFELEWGNKIRNAVEMGFYEANMRQAQEWHGRGDEKEMEVRTQEKEQKVYQIWDLLNRDENADLNPHLANSFFRSDTLILSDVIDQTLWEKYVMPSVGGSVDTFTPAVVFVGSVFEQLGLNMETETSFPVLSGIIENVFQHVLKVDSDDKEEIGRALLLVFRTDDGYVVYVLDSGPGIHLSKMVKGEYDTPKAGSREFLERIIHNESESVSNDWIFVSASEQYDQSTKEITNPRFATPEKGTLFSIRIRNSVSRQEFGGQTGTDFGNRQDKSELRGKLRNATFDPLKWSRRINQLGWFGIVVAFLHFPISLGASTSLSILLSFLPLLFESTLLSILSLQASRFRESYWKTIAWMSTSLLLTFGFLQTALYGLPDITKLYIVFSSIALRFTTSFTGVLLGKRLFPDKKGRSWREDTVSSARWALAFSIVSGYLIYTLYLPFITEHLPTFWSKFSFTLSIGNFTAVLPLITVLGSVVGQKQNLPVRTLLKKMFLTSPIYFITNAVMFYAVWMVDKYYNNDVLTAVTHGVMFILFMGIFSGLVSRYVTPTAQNENQTEPNTDLGDRQGKRRDLHETGHPSDVKEAPDIRLSGSSISRDGFTSSDRGELRTLQKLNKQANYPESRIWPFSWSTMRPLSFVEDKVSSSFLTVLMSGSAYGGWIWILMMSYSRGGYKDRFVKSLSNVMRILFSPFAFFATLISDEPSATRTQSWPRSQSAFMSLQGTSSSIKNFISKMLNLTLRKEGILDSLRIQSQIEEQHGRVQVSDQGSSLYQQFRLVLHHPQGVQVPSKPVPGSLENRVFHAGWQDLQIHTSELVDPLFLSPNNNFNSNTRSDTSQVDQVGEKGVGSLLNIWEHFLTNAVMFYAVWVVDGFFKSGVLTARDSLGKSESRGKGKQRFELRGEGVLESLYVFGRWVRDRSRNPDPATSQSLTPDDRLQLRKELRQQTHKNGTRPELRANKQSQSVLARAMRTLKKMVPVDVEELSYGYSFSPDGQLLNGSHRWSSGMGNILLNLFSGKREPIKNIETEKSLRSSSVPFLFPNGVAISKHETYDDQTYLTRTNANTLTNREIILPHLIRVMGASSDGQKLVTTHALRRASFLSRDEEGVKLVDFETGTVHKIKRSFVTNSFLSLSSAVRSIMDVVFLFLEGFSGPAVLFLMALGIPGIAALMTGNIWIGITGFISFVIYVLLFEVLSVKFLSVTEKIEFSSDDRWFLIYYANGFVELYDAETGTWKDVLYGTGDTEYHLSKDGKKLVALKSHGKVHVFDIQSGSFRKVKSVLFKGPLAKFYVKRNALGYGILSPNASFLAVRRNKTYYEYEPNVLDLRTGVYLLSDGLLKEVSDQPSFHPSSSEYMLLSGNQVSLVNLKDGGTVMKLIEKNYNEEIKSARFSPDGKRIEVVLVLESRGMNEQVVLVSFDLEGHEVSRVSLGSKVLRADTFGEGSVVAIQDYKSKVRVFSLNDLMDNPLFTQLKDHYGDGAIKIMEILSDRMAAGEIQTEGDLNHWINVFLTLDFKALHHFVGDKAIQFVEDQFLSLISKIKKEGVPGIPASDITEDVLVSYTQTLSHLIAIMNRKQPQASEFDILNEDDRAENAQFLFSGVFNPYRLRGIFDIYFNSFDKDQHKHIDSYDLKFKSRNPSAFYSKLDEAFKQVHRQQTRRLDFHFFIPFMTHLVDSETKITREADIFFKLFTSKKLHQRRTLKVEARMKLSLLGSKPNTEATKLLRQILSVLDRYWRLTEMGSKKLNQRVSGESDEEQYQSFLFVRELFDWIDLALDFMIVSSLDKDPLQKDHGVEWKPRVLRSMERVKLAARGEVNDEYGILVRAKQQFRHFFNKQEEGMDINFNFLMQDVPGTAEEKKTYLGVLRHYVRRVPINQAGKTVFDSVKQFIQANRGKESASLPMKQALLQEALGTFRKWRYGSNDYQTTLKKWEQIRLNTSEVKEDEVAAQAKRIKKNWEANQYYLTRMNGKGSFFLGFTDNFSTLVNIGNPSSFYSCQACNRSTFNAGLAGTVSNGWNKALVAFDQDGNFKARRIVRLRLKEDGEIVLLREKTYGDRSFDRIFEHMLAKVANDMGVRYQSDTETEKEKISISLWKGNSQWEYSDAYGSQFREMAGLIKISDDKVRQATLRISLSYSDTISMGPRFEPIEDDFFKLIADQVQTSAAELQSDDNFKPSIPAQDFIQAGDQWFFRNAEVNPISAAALSTTAYGPLEDIVMPNGAGPVLVRNSDRQLFFVRETHNQMEPVTAGATHSELRKDQGELGHVVKNEGRFSPAADVEVFFPVVDVVFDPKIQRNPEHRRKAARTIRSEVRTMGMDRVAVMLRRAALKRLKMVRPNASFVQVEAVERFVNSLFDVLDREGLGERDLTIAKEILSDESGLDLENFADALLGVRGQLNTVILSGKVNAFSKFAARVKQAGIFQTSVRNVDRLKETSFLGQKLLPVLRGELRDVLLNPLLVSISVLGEEMNDPLLDLAESTLQVVAGILIASRAEKEADVRDSDFQAALLRDLFESAAGTDAMSFKGQSILIHRKALKAHLEHLADTKLAVAA
jgi:ubiquinone/menaquinone biosynthesis C-methylase UbiE